MEEPTTDFKARHMPEEITEDEEKIPSTQRLWEIKMKKCLYI